MRKLIFEHKETGDLLIVTQQGIFLSGVETRNETIAEEIRNLNGVYVDALNYIDKKLILIGEL